MTSLSREDPRFACLVPAPVMEKRYSRAYFTEAVKATHAPLKALGNFIPSPVLTDAPRN